MNAPAALPKLYGMADNAGNVSLYHLGEHNRCPSCGWAQWHVGRVAAECMRCFAAVPLASPCPAPIKIDFDDNQPRKELSYAAS